jgi:hypothetical protein
MTTHNPQGIKLVDKNDFIFNADVDKNPKNYKFNTNPKWTRYTRTMDFSTPKSIELFNYSFMSQNDSDYKFYYIDRLFIIKTDDDNNQYFNDEYGYIMKDGNEKKYYSYDYITVTEEAMEYYTNIYYSYKMISNDITN